MIATAQEFAPGVRIVVWDLGLRDEQAPKVSGTIFSPPANEVAIRESNVFSHVCHSFQELVCDM